MFGNPKNVLDHLEECSKSIKRSRNANRNYSQLILARTMPVTSSRAIKISSGEHFHAG